jgi:hypothetical protein
VSRRDALLHKAHTRLKITDRRDPPLTDGLGGSNGDVSTPCDRPDSLGVQNNYATHAEKIERSRSIARKQLNHGFLYRILQSANAVIV